MAGKPKRGRPHTGRTARIEARVKPETRQALIDATCENGWTLSKTLEFLIAVAVNHEGRLQQLEDIVDADRIEIHELKKQILKVHQENKRLKQTVIVKRRSARPAEAITWM